MFLAGLTDEQIDARAALRTRQLLRTAQGEAVAIRGAKAKLIFDLAFPDDGDLDDDVNAHDLDADDADAAR